MHAVNESADPCRNRHAGSCRRTGGDTMQLNETNATPEQKTIVVIGNGKVGHRFCERMAELDEGNAFRIVAFGDEPHAAYDRVHSSEIFGSTTAEDLRRPNPAYLRERPLLLLERDPLGFWKGLSALLTILLAATLFILL